MKLTTCSCSAQCFVSIILLNLQNNPLRDGLLLSPYSTAEKTNMQRAEYVVCGLTGSTWQDLSHVAWLYLPHFIYSPLIHTQRAWLNSHPLLSVINMQLANSQSHGFVDVESQELQSCFAVALTSQDKKSRCNGPSSRSQWGTGA